ncbi:outer membrane protein transport protein [bacterium]|nr:outer membrane protein transport protein [bacterium]
MNRPRTSRRIIVASILALTFLLRILPARAQRPPVVPINLSNLRVDFIQVSARPAALGGAFIGAAQDETAAPINPAGLTYLTSVGVSLHQRRGQFRFSEPQRSPQNPDAKKKFSATNFDQSMVSVFVPAKPIFLSSFRQVSFDSRFNFETEQFLTIEPPLTTEQTLGGAGNFPGREVDLDLQMVSDAISIGFELSRRVSIGFTAKISVLDFNLNEKTFLDPDIQAGETPDGNLAETTYSISTVDHRSAEPGFTVGLMSKLWKDKLFLGAVYHANPAFSLKSATFLPEFRTMSQTLTTLSHEQSFKFSVPDVYGFGLYYITVANRLRFTFDWVRVEYSDLLKGNNRNAVADDILNEQTGRYTDPDGQPDLTIDDATELHFGVEYLYKSRQFGLIPLRFGFFTNPGHRIYSSSNDPNMRRLFPKAKDRLHFTMGLGLVLTSHLKFDASLDVSSEGFSVIASTLLSIPF